MNIADRKKEAMSKGHTLCLVSQKGNKVYKTLETTMGKAQLVMWGLQNTSKSRRAVIFETATGQITDIIEGNSSGFPEIKKDLYAEELYVEIEEK